MFSSTSRLHRPPFHALLLRPIRPAEHTTPLRTAGAAVRQYLSAASLRHTSWPEGRQDRGIDGGRRSLRVVSCYHCRGTSQTGSTSVAAGLTQPQSPTEMEQAATFTVQQSLPFINMFIDPNGPGPGSGVPDRNSMACNRCKRSKYKVT